MISLETTWIACNLIWRQQILEISFTPASHVMSILSLLLYYSRMNTQHHAHYPPTAMTYWCSHYVITQDRIPGLCQHKYLVSSSHLPMQRDAAVSGPPAIPRNPNSIIVLRVKPLPLLMRWAYPMSKGSRQCALPMKPLSPEFLPHQPVHGTGCFPRKGKAALPCKTLIKVHNPLFNTSTPYCCFIRQENNLQCK